MKDQYKLIFMDLFAIITAFSGIYFILNKYTNYGLIVLSISLSSFIIRTLWKSNRKNSSIKYLTELKHILKTYDSVMVESKKLPSLKDKTIIMISNIEDLIDAQTELRKPIYYFKQTDTCSFTLFDQEQALIYILKENEELISPIEIELREMQVRDKKNNIDEEILEQISRTTIVKLPNNKSYKISPVRKRQEDTIEVL